MAEVISDLFGNDRSSVSVSDLHNIESNYLEDLKMLYDVIMNLAGIKLPFDMTEFDPSVRNKCQMTSIYDKHNLFFCFKHTQGL